MPTDWAALDRDTNDTIVAVAIDKYGMLAAFTTRPVYHEVSCKWSPTKDGKRYNLGLITVAEGADPIASLEMRPVPVEEPMSVAAVCKPIQPQLLPQLPNPSSPYAGWTMRVNGGRIWAEFEKKDGGIHMTPGLDFGSDPLHALIELYFMIRVEAIQPIEYGKKPS